MCSAARLRCELQYTKEPPTAPGDYLWICQWDCGCVRQSGLCWINPDGELCWEGDGPPSDWEYGFAGDLSVVDWWARIDLPPGDDAWAALQAEEARDGREARPAAGAADDGRREDVAG